jgi:hypothetical protein
MKIEDVIDDSRQQEEYKILNERCLQFIIESQGYPLLKNLPITYGDFQKIKVRHRNEELNELYTEAFDVRDLRRRAIFANGLTSFEPVYEELEPFYIFPINGFKFLYSKEVENSSQEYKQVFDVMYENFGSEKGNEIIIDLLKFTYSSDKLHEGISNGSEIIIFNIPFYYAIRANTIISYLALVEKIKNIDV